MCSSEGWPYQSIFFFFLFFCPAYFLLLNTTVRVPDLNSVYCGFSLSSQAAFLSLYHCQSQENVSLEGSIFREVNLDSKSVFKSDGKNKPNQAWRLWQILFFALKLFQTEWL